jgi:hypothetical protein
MRYIEFKEQVKKFLKDNPSGVTWKELRDRLDLSYKKPCPEWTRKLEAEIGLNRVKGKGRALVWKLPDH